MIVFLTDIANTQIINSSENGKNDRINMFEIRENIFKQINGNEVLTVILFNNLIIHHSF